MSAVQSIAALMWTSDYEDAGTDGNVYLGLGGREFYLDIWDTDDNERGRGYTATLGPGATISHPGMNDPRFHYPLHTEELDGFPVYLRFRSDDHWRLTGALVLIYGGTSSSDMHFSRGYSTPYPVKTNGGLWLGPSAGECIHLRLSYLWEFDRKMMAKAKLPARLMKLLPKWEAPPQTEAPPQKTSVAKSRAPRRK